MKSFKILSLSLVIALAGCARHNDNTVVIHSVPADSIYTEINVFAKPHWMPRVETDVTFKGGTTCRFDIDTVEIRYFSAFSGNHDFATEIFVTPGDSVSCKTITKEINGENSYEIIFEGKNAAHYNYYTQKREAFSWEELPDYYSLDLPEYKRQLQAFRDKEKEFLRNYKKTHTVSEDFINYALAEINNWYVYRLCQPAYFIKCVTIPNGYFDDAVITQNPLSTIVIEALQFKYIYCSPSENMEQIYNTILNEVHPQFQSTILSTLIIHFAEKGGSAYKKSFLKVMNQIEKTSTDSTLLATVQEYSTYYLLSGKMLPDSILDKTYLRSFQNEQKITLRQLLDNYKNTAVYLDIWGSWCVSCRQITKASAENKPYFVEKNIAVVYLSLDEDESKWLQAAKNDHITENQYLLYNLFANPLLRYLNINSYPRYVLFNKNHEIGILNAPRPVDCGFEELKKIIERNPEKFITEKLVVKNTNIVKKEAPKQPVFKDCADSTKFIIKTIYHDNFGTFSSATNYVDAWGTPRTPARNWQTTYSPYTIPKHRIKFGSPDDGYYTIGTLKKGVMWDNTRGDMTEDASGNPNGAVLCINVAENYKGEIYRQQINNLSPNVILYFEVSIANANYGNSKTTPPQVEIRIEKTDGQLLGNAHSNLVPTTFGWQKINIDVPPIAETSVVLRVISTGDDWKNGCDLLMDDIIFRICSRR